VKRIARKAFFDYTARQFEGETMNNKVLAIVGGGCLVLLLCGVCAVGVYVFGGSQLNQLASQLGLPVSQDGSAPVQGRTGTGGPLGLPPATGSANQPSSAPSSGSTSSGNPFADALTKAKGAQKFRYDVSWVFGSTKNGKYTEEPFLDMSGEVDGKNSHTTTKAGIFSMFAGGGSLEIIDADDKSYWKGVNFAGMTDPKVWYIQKDSSSSNTFEDFARPDYWNGFSSSDSGDYKKARSDQVDGQSCDVYLYDMKNVKNAAMVGLLGSAQDQNAFSVIDKAETNFWLCGDGFVHKFSLEYSGHDAKNPTNKSGMRWSGHFYDFNNASIRITAPAGAKPMPGQ
jgi:hypothetical protein